MADSSDLIVIASAKAKPGHAKELERALREVRNRPGRSRVACCSACIALRRTCRSWLVLSAGRPEDHQRHLQGAHVQRLMFAMADSLAEPPQSSSYEIVDEN